MVGDPFLSDPKAKNKRNRVNRTTSTTRVNKRSKPAPVLQDEEISDVSDSEDQEDNGPHKSKKLNEDADDDNDSIDSEEEFEGENAADKRRRLAKQYLENLKQEAGEYDFDAQDLDNDIISKRLREDVAETKGHVYRFISENLLLSDIKPVITRVGSKPLTGLSVRFPYAFTVSKDMELVKWSIEDFKKKPHRVKHVRGGRKFVELSDEPHKNGHADEILTVAASPDGRYVVTGGRDKRIIIWNTEALSPFRVLSTHDRRGEVLGMAFRRNSDNLYVSCADLKVRSYSINQFAELETLYGHQDVVVDIAALGQERCITVGARDRTAMLWKIADETRLTFRGGELEKKKKRKQNDDEMDVEDDDDEKFFAEGSIDCVSMIDDSHFVTGSDNGSISLWSLAKKKPLFTQHIAHGILPQIRPESASAEKDQNLKNLQVPQPQPYWITAVHAIPYSDIFISGSWNGVLKLWRLDHNLRSFTLLGNLPNARGVVTRIDVAEQGAHNKESFRVMATLAKEHRLGRWVDAGKGARNAIYSVVIDQQNLSEARVSE